MPTFARRHFMPALLAVGLLVGFLVGDTASAIAQAGQTGGAQMRTGKVSAFDSSTGALTVNVAGTDMTIPYNPAYLPLVGDNVIVMQSGATWYVMGSATNTASRLLPVTDSVVDFEGTNSAAFVDLDTVGPSVTVTIGATGRATVTLSAQIICNSQSTGAMGVALSGANTAAADIVQALSVEFNTADNTEFMVEGASRVLLFEGLNPGVTTFTAKYQGGGGVPLSIFSNRVLTIQPY